MSMWDLPATIVARGCDAPDSSPWLGAGKGNVHATKAGARVIAQRATTRCKWDGRNGMTDPSIRTRRSIRCNGGCNVRGGTVSWEEIQPSRQCRRPETLSDYQVTRFPDPSPNSAVLLPGANGHRISSYDQ